MWGTSRTLVANVVSGVTKGFEEKLEITGVGYRAAVQGKTLQLQLGFSHDVNFPIPEGIAIATPKPTEIVVSGVDKQKVGHVAAEIRGCRSSGRQSTFTLSSSTTRRARHWSRPRRSRSRCARAPRPAPTSQPRKR